MQGHSYYVFVTGIDAEPKTFGTRLEAEIYMHKVCYRNHIKNLECVECDKHERKYSNSLGIKFYINRV